MRLLLLLLILSFSLAAVTYSTNLKSKAFSLPCPTYNISSNGIFTSSDPTRRVQITINGAPQNKYPIVPPEGIYTWQVVDDQNCLSSGSYTPASKITPNTNPDYPLLIPTLAK